MIVLGNIGIRSHGARICACPPADELADVGTPLRIRKITMLLTEFQPTSDTRESRRRGRFGLRVRYEAEDRVVDLPCGKTTIGSSPRCNLRIQQTGVQPLQCLVVCDSEGLSVRRWAADTFVNGELFDDARLSVGDHLSLGPVDLEVVEIANDGFQDTAEFQVPAEERRDEFTAERGHEFSPPSASSGFDQPNPSEPLFRAG